MGTVTAPRKLVVTMNGQIKNGIANLKDFQVIVAGDVVWPTSIQSTSGNNGCNGPVCQGIVILTLPLNVLVGQVVSVRYTRRETTRYEELDPLTRASMAGSN